MEQAAGIITTDAGGAVVFLNTAAQTLTGWNAAEALGKPLTDVFRIVDESTQARLELPVAAVLAGQSKTASGGSALLAPRRGTELPVEFSLTPIQHECARIVGVALVCVNIAQRRRAEEERAQLHAKVLHQEKLAAIGLLASGLAHEVGNPLASIQVVCDNQLRKQNTPVLAEKFQRIREQTTRIVEIMGQLVAFARPAPDRWRPVALNDAIHSTLGVARLSRAAKRVNVRLELDPQLPLTVAAGDQLSQVFLNLFVNAFDAMQDSGGELLVRSETLPHGAIRVAVQDNGRGIAKEHLQSLFTPFFTTKEIGKGTGLGLHISEGIIRRHGGQITVASEPGKGATFTVEIPVRTSNGNEPQRR